MGPRARPHPRRPDPDHQQEEEEKQEQQEGEEQERQEVEGGGVLGAGPACLPALPALPGRETKQQVLRLMVDRIVVEDARIGVHHVVPIGPIGLQTRHLAARRGKL